MAYTNIHENLTGKKFNQLLVVGYLHKQGRRHIWECLCDCGNKYSVRSDSLKNGHTKSCGCLGPKLAKERETTHGYGGTIEYIAWKHMIYRCSDSTHRYYKSYGGRGIKVCDRWIGDFGIINFVKDMGKRPSKDYSLDRIDNNKGYSPENCRWATRKQQQRNTRHNHIVEYMGRRLTIAELAEENSVDYDILVARINLKWDIEKALTVIPKKTGRQICWSPRS